MEQYVVSALKYRPQDFEEVIGQEAITRTLDNAIKQNHLAQALLFCGPRGVGKTTCARILARKINSDDSSSNVEDFSFNIFELDAASNNSVDDIRSLTDQVRIPPQNGHYKVYIIDEAHMLSSAAFNAFLKTLEEPPKHAVFILATTEKHKIIPTILSRCQIFDFKRITVSDTVNYLQKIAQDQEVEAEEEALHIIAQKAEGAMRDALSIFDRIVSYSGNRISRKDVSENLNILDYDNYFKLSAHILENSIPSLLLEFDELLKKGFDGHHVIAGLSSHFRDFMVSKHQPTQELLQVPKNIMSLYIDQAQKWKEEWLLEAIDISNSCELSYNNSENQRLHAELCLMQLASISHPSKKKKFRLIDPQWIEGIETAIIPQTEALVPSKAPTEKEIPTLVESEVLPEVELPKMELKQEHQVSGLSLAGMALQKKHRKEKAQQQTKSEEDKRAKEVSLEELHVHWNNYIDQLDAKGKKIMAANLNMDQPQLNEAFLMSMTVPNQIIQQEIDRNKFELLQFLRDKLENDHLDLQVIVKEEMNEKYIFTPEEKYKKMVEQNPSIALLKDTFDLEY